MLSIDGTNVWELRASTYTSVSLRSGSYELSLRPSATDSQIWSGSFVVSVEANKVYYIAFWNDVEYSGLGFQLVPVLGRRVFFIPVQASSARSIALRSEVVSEEDALPVLTKLRFTAPLREVFDVKP